MKYFVFTALMCILLNACTESTVIKTEVAQSEVTESSACRTTTTSNYSAALTNYAAGNFDAALIGESHGNLQSIEFARELLLSHLDKNEAVTFLLEGGSETGFVQFFNGSQKLSKVLTGLPDSFFWGRSNDGRQSCGLLAMLTRIAQHPNVEKFELVLIAPSKGDSGLKGHVMAQKLIAYQKENVDRPMVVITGRNYQRFISRYDLGEVSSMCRWIKERSEINPFCIGTVGLLLPEKELPCGENESFDLIAPRELKDDFFEDFDAILSSPSRCSDYTGLAFPR